MTSHRCCPTGSAPGSHTKTSDRVGKRGHVAMPTALLASLVGVLLMHMLDAYVSSSLVVAGFKPNRPPQLRWIPELWSDRHNLGDRESWLRIWEPLAEVPIILCANQVSFC
jgi:hypothetical protein